MTRVARIPGRPPWPQLVFHPNGEVIVVSGVLPGSDEQRCAVRLVGVGAKSTDKVIGKLRDLPSHVAVSRDGRFVAASDIRDRMEMWDTRGGIARLELDERFWGWPLAFHPSRDVCAFVNTADPNRASCQVVVADFTGREILHRLDHSPVVVGAMAFSPDGASLATGADDGSLRLWDVGSGALVQSLSAHKRGIASVAYSPAGGVLASGGWGWKQGRSESEIVVWDLKTLRERHLESFHSRLESLSFSRDGRVLVTVGGMIKGEIGIWDPTNGELLARVEGERGKPFWVVSCSPTADLLAVSVHDGSIEIWDFGEVGRGG
jgi:WD40 repeat protein